MKITVEFEFDETWDSYEDTHPEIIMEDALRELADGVGYKIINRTFDKVSFDSIEQSVCEFVKITPEELQFKTRKREVVEGRQICHFLSRENKLGSLREIAFRFGHKDHATVLHSIKTVKELIETNKDYQKKYKSFIESFQ